MKRRQTRRQDSRGQQRYSEVENRRRSTHRTPLYEDDFGYDDEDLDENYGAMGRRQFTAGGYGDDFQGQRFRGGYQQGWYQPGYFGEQGHLPMGGYLNPYEPYQQQHMGWQGNRPYQQSRYGQGFDGYNEMQGRGNRWQNQPYGYGQPQGFQPMDYGHPGYGYGQQGYGQQSGGYGNSWDPQQSSWIQQQQHQWRNRNQQRESYDQQPWNQFRDQEEYDQQRTGWNQQRDQQQDQQRFQESSFNRQQNLEQIRNQDASSKDDEGPNDQSQSFPNPSASKSSEDNKLKNKK